MAGKVILKKKQGISAPEIGEVVVTCPGGAETTVRDELSALGFSRLHLSNGAVRAAAGARDIPLLNRALRSASRVLVPLAAFDAENYEEVYRHAGTVLWDRLLTPDHTFMISALSRSDELKDHRYLAMKVKDAIVDRQRAIYKGRRSSVDKEHPHLIISAFAAGTHVELAVDSSGRPLHERGYRLEAGDAPLRENVAAMMLLDAGYHPEDRRVVFDPFCGSGTLVIEAALIHTGGLPGALGRSFAWERWPWVKLKEEAPPSPADHAGADQHGKIGPLFIGCDSDPLVIQKAQRNAERAGVAHLIRFETADVSESIPKWTKNTRGLLVTNPPYGVRLQQEGLDVLYSQFGDLLRNHAGGWDIVLLSGDSRLVNRLRLRSEKRQRIYNGPLECSLDYFRVYEHSGDA